MKLHRKMDDLVSKGKATQISFSDLKIKKKIGQGSFAIVYKATWDESAVAVKIFSSANAPSSVLDVGNSLSLTHGSKSQVYSAQSRTHDQLPVIDDETEKELWAEIVLTSQIPYHTNVVKIMGFCKDPLCVVMQFMDGGSVRRIVYGQSNCV